MVLQRSTRLVPLMAVLAVALSAATAQAKPTANAAGGDAPALTPSVVGVPIQRTDTALGNAADAIDGGNGAQAVGPLTASRRNLIRSYRGAKALIATMPPPEAEEASLSSRKFVRMARRFIRASHRGRSGWIRAQASDEPAGPVFADTPTAVFSVFTSQYEAATTAAGLVADTKGNLLNRVKTTLNTAIILRNRLVKIVHAASPPPAEEGRVHARASQEEGEVPTFDVVMPGLTVLLGDELQQLQSLASDQSVPAASRTALSGAIAADNQINTLVNTWWPPATED